MNSPHKNNLKRIRDLIEWLCYGKTEHGMTFSTEIDDDQFVAHLEDADDALSTLESDLEFEANSSKLAKAPSAVTVQECATNDVLAGCINELGFTTIKDHNRFQYTPDGTTWLNVTVDEVKAEDVEPIISLVGLNQTAWDGAQLAAENPPRPQLDNTPTDDQMHDLIEELAGRHICDDECRSRGCKDPYRAELVEDDGSFDDDTLNLVEEPGECGMCGGPTGIMGILGNLEHTQCRNCGAQFSHERSA